MPILKVQPYIIDSTKDFTFNNVTATGSVGVGTNSPSEKLHVASGSNEYAIQWNNSTANSWVLGSATNRAYIVNKSLGFEVLTLLNGGSVGIGTASPSTKLNVYNASASNTLVRPQNSLAYADFGPISDGTIYGPYAAPASGKSLVIGTSNAAPVSIYTSGTERSRFESNGVVTVLGNISGTSVSLSGSQTISSTLGVTGNINGSGITLTGSLRATGPGDFDGGLQSTPIGNASASTGAFTTLTASSAVISTATGRVALGTDSGGSLSIGPTSNTASSSAPYIDFNSSATAVDYDVRLMATGNSAVVGGGTLTATAGTFSVTGNVGIGTSSPSGKLDVAGTNGSVRINATGDQLEFTRNGYSYITASGAAATLQVQASGASGVLTLGTAGTERARIDSNGNFSVGTTGGDYSRTWRSVFRQDQNGTTQIGVINANTGGSAVTQITKIGGTGNNFIDWGLYDNAGAPYDQFNYGTGVQSVRWVLGGSERMRLASDGVFTVTGVSNLNGNVNTNNIMPFGNANANIGSNSLRFNTVFAKATSAQYADLAEIYSADSNYQPGTVVVFGGDKEITVTTISHDTRVAGVISTNPAYLMNTASEGLPVAFTGRVPCLVKGPVQKGDVLVTSSIPGVAEKIDLSLHTPGCILGKSLEELTTNDTQLIEVVVGRF